MGILDPTEQYLRLYQKQIRQALAVLKAAQRYDYGSEAYMEAPLQPSESGDWIAVDDVVKVIQILEGQR